jgi:hypothetical protein
LLFPEDRRLTKRKLANVLVLLQIRLHMSAKLVENEFVTWLSG